MRHRATLGVVSVILILSLLLTPVAALPGTAYAAGPPDQAPVHVSPAEDATGLSLTPTFEWDPVPEATHYALYISKDPYGPAHLVFNSEEHYEPDHGPITGTSFKLPGGFLEQDVKYRWNMRAGNADGWGPYSDAEQWYFTTGNLAQLIEDNIMEDGEGRDLKFPVTVDGEEYFIVYLDSYIDPQTWETHPPRGLCEPVFVDAQGRPVHDKDMARKVAMIDSARRMLYKPPPDFLGYSFGLDHIDDELASIDGLRSAHKGVEEVEWQLDVSARALSIVLEALITGSLDPEDLADFIIEVAEEVLPEDAEQRVYEWVADKLPGQLTGAEIARIVELTEHVASQRVPVGDDTLIHLDGARFLEDIAAFIVANLGEDGDPRDVARMLAMDELDKASEALLRARSIVEQHSPDDPFSGNALADYDSAVRYAEGLRVVFYVHRAPATDLLTRVNRIHWTDWNFYWQLLADTAVYFAKSVIGSFVGAADHLLAVEFAELVTESIDTMYQGLQFPEAWEWLDEFRERRDEGIIKLQDYLLGDTEAARYTLQLAAGLPAPELVTLTLDSTPGGWVAWPGEEEFTHEEGMEVALVAMWDEGYQFSHWSGDVDTITDITADFTTIVMDSDKSVTAHFEEVEDGTFPGALETTLWGYYAAWEKVLPSIEERGKMFEVLGLGLADEYVGAFDQNNELLDALKALRIAPLTVEELLRYLEFAEDIANVDLVLVLDRSGSMDWSMGPRTRMEVAIEAATSVVNMLMPHDKVAVVSFATDATTDAELTGDFDHARAEIQKIVADGWTSFGAGMELAVQELKERGSEDHVPVIVFMSDGIHNREPDPEPYVEECADLGIPIYTVGFADTPAEVGEELLKWMAEETGGEYFFAADLYSLENVFLTFTLEATGWPLDAEFSGQVGQGGTVVAGTFDVEPGTEYVRVTLNWPGSDLDLIIERPDGTEVRLGTGPDNIYSGDNAKPEWAILLEPEPGTWTVKVYGKRINPHSDYIVWVSTYVDPSREDPDRPIPVGGSAYPVSRLALLAPWIALTVIMAGAGLLVLRRRRAQI